MSYTDYQIEHHLNGGEASYILSSSNASLFLTPGCSPISVRTVAAVVVLTAGSVTDADSVLTVVKQPTAGGRLAGETLGTITIPAGTATGQVFYIDMNARIRPGEQLGVRGNGGPSDGRAHVVALIQPSWEHPSANPNMTSGEQSS